MKLHLTLFFALIVSCLGQCRAFSANDFYLFTSFRGNGEDGLHLMLSTNGYQWSPLKKDKSFLAPEIGGKLMRDPCIAQGPDGVFHLVWTTSWDASKGKWMGYSSSKDLIHWTPQIGIEVMKNEPSSKNVWAPELFYDKKHRQWMIFWSTTIPGKFASSDSTGDDGYNHRFYYTLTKDFKNFTESKLLYDPGFNCIDATLLAVEKRHGVFLKQTQFYLFFKDERKNPLKKNIRYATALNVEGPYGPAAESFTGDWVEGPSVIKIKDDYLVYFDHYGSPAYYGAVRSKDLTTWQDCSKEMSFPPGHRHGTIIQVSPSIASALGVID